MLLLTAKAIATDNLAEVQQVFSRNSISYNLIGEITNDSQLVLNSKQQSHLFWDLKTSKFITYEKE